MIKKIKQKSKKEEHKRLLSNFISLAILQGTNYILPLITFPYLVRVLGVEKFGLVMFAQSFIIFFNVFVDFGFNLSAVREVSIHRDDKDKLTEIFSSVITIKFILIFISLIILTITVFSFDKFKHDKILYYLTFLVVIGQAMFPVWYFQGIERMQYITIVNVTSKLLFTIAIFIFVHTSNDYLLVPLLNGLGYIIGGMLAIYLIHTKFHQNFQLQKISTLVFYLKESVQFFLSRVSSIGYSNINTFLIGNLLNNRYVTYYYIADKIISIILAIFDPVVQTIYPYLSKNFNKNFFKKLLIIILIVSIFILLILCVFGDFLSIFLLKEINNTFLSVLHILMVLIPISIIYVFIGAPLLLAKGYKREFNLSIMYGFILHLFILFIIYFVHKIFFINNILYLFAVSVIISKVCVLCIRLFYIYKYKLYKG